MSVRIINARIISDGRVSEGLEVIVSEAAGRFHQGSRLGQIQAVGTAEECAPYCDACTETVDLGGAYLAPGFIDLHVHGGAGAEFIDGTEEAIRTAAALHAANGTRVMYPTISAADFSVYHQVLGVLSEIRDELGLEIPGVHLEGPYLAREMCGAQNTSFIHAPRPAEYEKLYACYGGLIKRWTYAPELDPDRSFLHFLTSHGITPSVGHAATEYEELMPAFRDGCRLVTHFYSCCSSVVRRGGFRHLGIIETAYGEDGMFVETIADNRHLPPELLRLIYKLKGPERICMVTDAIRPAGCADGETGLSGGVAYVVEDGVAKLSDRSAFAGSISTTIHLLECAVADGIALPEAVRMLTETPAAVMGLANKGRIRAGYDAQFTVFDDRFKVLSVL